MSLLDYLPMILYLLFVVVALVLAVVVIRFLLAATRLMNRKSEALELESRREDASTGRR
jgi:cell division protein FtsL